MTQGIKDILDALKQLQSTIYLACDAKPADDISKIVKDAVAEITSLREQLEIAKKDGWISVDTALPELRDDSVLAHFANGSIETIHIEDYFRQITDGFDSNGNQKYTRWYLHSTPLVTHWKPLPEPPKE